MTSNFSSGGAEESDDESECDCVLCDRDEVCGGLWLGEDNTDNVESFVSP